MIVCFFPRVSIPCLQVLFGALTNPTIILFEMRVMKLMCSFKYDYPTDSSLFVERNSNRNRGKAKTAEKHLQDIFIWNSITFNLLWLVCEHTNWNGWKRRETKTEGKLKIVLHSMWNCHHLTGKCPCGVLVLVIQSHDMCFNPIEIISNKKQARTWWWLDILFACLLACLWDWLLSFFLSLFPTSNQCSSGRIYS